MRTTLTLDPDVARLLDDEVHRLRKPRRQVVNDTLRQSLTSSRGKQAVKRYLLRPHVARLLTRLPSDVPQ